MEHEFGDTRATQRDARRAPLPLLALASFASAANLRVCDPLLPQIAGELGVTVGTAAMMVTAFALAYGVFQVWSGRSATRAASSRWSCWARSGPASPP